VTSLFAQTGFQRPRIRISISSISTWPGTPSPPTYATLPARTRFSFKSVSEYLDDLATRIYAPQLDRLFITFFNQLFNAPHLSQFISRIPKFQSPDKARAVFHGNIVKVTLPSPTRMMLGYEALYSGDFKRRIRLAAFVSRPAL
jgi:hypothetical protein